MSLPNAMSRFWLLQIINASPAVIIPGLEEWFWSEVLAFRTPFEYEQIESVYNKILGHCRANRYRTLKKVKENYSILQEIESLYVIPGLEEWFRSAVRELDIPSDAGRAEWVYNRILALCRERRYRTLDQVEVDVYIQRELEMLSDPLTDEEIARLDEVDDYVLEYDPSD